MVKHLAFSLIELLVVIAVLAILIGVAIATLGSSRSAVRNTASISNLRSHAQAFAAYAGDYSDCWPYFTREGFFNNTITSPWITLEGQRYFDAHRTWHIALGEAYSRASHDAEVFAPPGYKRPDGWGWMYYTPYYYSCAFIADQRFWNATTRRGPEQWRATRAGEVMYPSEKGLIFASWPYESRLSEPHG